MSCLDLQLIQSMIFYDCSDGGLITNGETHLDIFIVKFMDAFFTLITVGMAIIYLDASCH